MKRTIKTKDSALVVTDMLYDFIDGTLACAGANEAVAALKEYIEAIAAESENDEDAILGGYPVLFICDHHPANHSSFKEFGGIWPTHCVAGTRGGEVHKAIECYMDDVFTFYKGCDASKEQYSGFEGVNEAGQSLEEVLSLLEIKTVYVTGIATEYCVKNTAEDIKKAGYNVVVLKDCLGYVDAKGHEDTLKEFTSKGIEVI